MSGSVSVAAVGAQQPSVLYRHHLFVFWLLSFIPGIIRKEKTGVGLHGNWREEVDSKSFTYLLSEGGGVKAWKLG